METRSLMDETQLSALVDAVLPRSWRRDSEWHGETHWRCVTATGLALGSATPEVDRSGPATTPTPVTAGVDRVVVFCFGLLHDTRRQNESIDPGHGPRAAAFAEELRAKGALALDPASFDVLTFALSLHSTGAVSSDATIGTCWDADRLHLPRVSIHPRDELLSTAAAHGEASLAAAARLREGGAPAWEELVRLAARASAAATESGSASASAFG